MNIDTRAEGRLPSRLARMRQLQAQRTSPTRPTPWVPCIATFVLCVACTAGAAGTEATTGAADEPAAAAAAAPIESGENPASDTATGKVGTDKVGTAEAVITAGLPPSVQRRLRERSTGLSMYGRSTVSRPIRFPSDAALLTRLVQLGYTEVDTFFIPITRVGSAPLVIRFDAKTDDARAEAIAIFRGVLDNIAATGTDFVAMYDSVGSPATTGDRFQWLFWNTPDDDWVLLNGDPDTYFESKLAELRQEATPNPSHEVAYISRRAHIEYTRGRRNAGSDMMREALRVIDAQPAEKPVRPRLQLDVLQSLLFQAASEKDEEDLGRLIRRYAELAARLNVSVGNRPVRTSAPEFPAGAHRDGYVELEFDVHEDGTTGNPRVRTTNLGAAYTTKAVAALRQWRFLPAVENGIAVPSVRTWRFSFETE